MRAAGLGVTHKVDQLPCLDFAFDRALANLRAVSPRAKVLRLSARGDAAVAGRCGWRGRARRVVYGTVFASVPEG